MGTPQEGMTTMRPITCLAPLVLLLAAQSCTALNAPPPAEMTGSVAWQFAGLTQLQAALDSARETDRLVLVGLAGSPG